MKRLLCITVSAMAENCYLVWDDASKEALVFDPGDGAEEISAAIEKAGLKPAGILLTHAHFDHIGGIPGLVSRHGLPVWCPAEDLPLYSSPMNCMMPWHGAVKGLPVPTDAPLPSFGFQVLKTPGHTPGGRCYYFPEEGFVLTGDTLFAGSVGRTDFPGGSERDLRRSILDVLFTLPPKTVAYPGHGPRTTVAIEKMDPFFS